MNKIKHSNSINQPIKVGDLFRIGDSDGNGTYILSYTGNDHVLVCIDDGCLWTDPIEKLEDLEKEIIESGFNKVTQPFTVTPCSN